MTAKKVSGNSINRLILYRKLLDGLQTDGVENVYSHKLAALANCTPALVRRDLMQVGYEGSPARGYNIEKLNASISNFLDSSRKQNVAIIGIGNLGRAILEYCFGRHPRLSIIAAFDNDPSKVNRVIHGTHCYHISDLESIVKKSNIEVAIISIPAGEAQPISERLVDSGVRAILNYSPTALNLPKNIYVENRDMMLALEKVAFFSRNTKQRKN